MGVSKNRGKYEQMDDFGVPLFLETPIYWIKFYYTAMSIRPSSGISECQSYIATSVAQHCDKSE